MDGAQPEFIILDFDAGRNLVERRENQCNNETALLNGCKKETDFPIECNNDIVPQLGEYETDTGNALEKLQTTSIKVSDRRRKCLPTQRIRLYLKKRCTRQNFYHLGGCLLLILVAMGISGLFILYQGK